MFSLRGRTVLTIFFMMTLTLLAIIYHILSNESDNVIKKSKTPSKSTKENYMLSLETPGSVLSPERRKVESQFLKKLRPQLSGPLFKGNKIVHLDLKGAPPVVEYYSYLLKLFKALGATGILLEYEDMFPYSGGLQNITAGNAYSFSDIKTIQKISEENNLMVIPLIQTFGHFEFILKLDSYKDLKEVYRYPQVICPTHAKTLPLIHEMIDQIVGRHPNIKYLHIGADEVYHLGECNRCQDIMSKNQWNKRQLFLSHVQKIASYIRRKYPELKILMWDDEFREISPSEIMEMGLQKQVIPVVWKYTKNPGASLNDQLWESYAEVWSEIWIATAFKGATEPDRYWTDISYHLENHQRWLEIIDRYSDEVNFKGAILTGWQRYDHFSVLCELLASSLPSLAVNLAALQATSLNDLMSETPSFVTEALQCEGPVSLSIPEPNYGWAKCRFLGANVYSIIIRLFNINQEITKMEQDNTFKGWLKEYNIRHAYSNPSHVEKAVIDLDKFKMELVSMEKEMKNAMEGIYDNFTFEEWMETFVVPLNDKITKLWDAKEKILDRNSWPRRPLKIEI